jgi:uncharacterized ion transporter superfamily protein YfcC
MVTLVIVLLAIWVIVAILGVVIKGLFWVTVIAAVLFVATVAIGVVRRRAVNK